MIFKCLNVLDICLNGVRDIGGCVRINFLSHTPLAPLVALCLKLTNQHTHHNILFQNRPPPSGGTFWGFYAIT